MSSTEDQQHSSPPIQHSSSPSHSSPSFPSSSHSPHSPHSPPPPSHSPQPPHSPPSTQWVPSSSDSNKQALPPRHHSSPSPQSIEPDGNLPFPSSHSSPPSPSHPSSSHSHSPSQWDHYSLYKQTAPYILSGVLQFIPDQLDVRILLWNSSLPFFGREEAHLEETRLFSQLSFPNHVKDNWIASCQQLAVLRTVIKFSYTIESAYFRVKMGIIGESGFLWYSAKSKTHFPVPSANFAIEHDLRLGLDVIPAIVWHANGSKIVCGNQMWTDYGGQIGYENEEATRLHLLSICHPDDFSWFWERWQNIATDREPFDGQVRIKRGDEDYRWFKVALAPLVDSGDKWMGMCTDIHDQKQPEMQAIVDKTISNFLAMMSHEMRTPLTGITGLLQWLMGTSLSPEQLDCCSTISICTDSLLVMINNLLDIMKFEDGKVELERNDMSPVKITEVCVDMFSRLAEPKKIEMIYDIDMAMPDLVISDSHRYQQVLTNLLSNAVKFTQEGGEIEVSLQLIGEQEALNFVKEVNFDAIKALFGNYQWLQISVRDNGIGIEKEKMPTIFRRFSQIEASLKNEIRGGGLGLAICRNIATLMHGAVTAISEQEKGSQFFFTAPVGVSPNAMPIVNPPPEISFPIPPCSIVLVSNPNLRRVFLKKLAHYKMEVLTLEEYKLRVGGYPGSLSMPIIGFGFGKESKEKDYAWKGGKARRMSGRGSWSDLSTIVEEVERHKEEQKREAAKEEKKEKESEHKVGPCIAFVDQLLWLEIDAETKEWLKRHGKICVVRMGQKDMQFEEGTRSLIKPVKDHMLFAECDIFLRSCELPINFQQAVPSELSKSRDVNLESLGIQFPLKVLIADDSAINLQVAGKLLQKIGHKEYSTVVNGNMVLDYFAANGPVEVVLMDMQMPGLDGCEATALLRQQYPKSVVHVIGFTATSFSEDREKCLSSGMCSFLSKPVKLSELEAELIKAWRAVNLRIVCGCNNI